MQQSRQVRAIANGGKDYRVTFSAMGKPERVEVGIWTRPAPEPHHWRRVWDAASGREISITAACAIRAAVYRSPST